MHFTMDQTFSGTDQEEGGKEKIYAHVCESTHTLHHLLLTLHLTYSTLEPILCNPFKDPLLRCAHVFAWALDELGFCVSPSNALPSYSINPVHLAGFFSFARGHAYLPTLVKLCYMSFQISESLFNIRGVGYILNECRFGMNACIHE